MSWNSDFKTLGIKVGRLRGIDVYFHWLFLITAACLLISSMRNEIAYPFLSWLVFLSTLILSLLLHELGHCFAASRQGGDAERIVIWPLGGLAYCEVPHDPRSQFLVSAAGPVANALLSILASAACLFAGWSLFSETVEAEQGFPFARILFQSLFLWNIFLLFINVIPCYPLDGGRMLQAALWSKLESPGHASWVTFRISNVFALGSLVTALLLWIFCFRDKEFSSHHPFWSQASWGLLLVALVHFYEAKAYQHRLAHGEEEDKIFGYDFSLGYTSLERTATREARRTSLWSSLREKYRRRADGSKRQREDALRKRL